MTLRIMIFDMRKLSRFLESRHLPIQVSDPAMQVWVIGTYCAQVRLKMLDVDYVKADDCCEEPDIGFGDLPTVVKWPVLDGREVRLSFIEGREESCDCLVIGFLRCGEAGFINAVVDVIVGPLVSCFDLGLQGGREQVDLSILWCEKVVKLLHTNDVRIASLLLVARQKPETKQGSCTSEHTSV